MLKLISASKIYDSSGVTALRRIDLHVARGDYVSVTGASGSGKSTLMHILGLLDTLSAGSYLLCGTDVSHLSPAALAARRASEIGFVFQQFQLLPGLTALENTALPLAIGGIPRSVRLARARAALLSVGLGDRMEHLPNALSGGQQQRVAIARALATSPKILLCDEATSALDPTTTTSILNLLREINRRMGITIVIITHEMNVIQKICNKVAVMDYGQVVETGSVIQVFSDPRSDIARRFVGNLIRDVIPEPLVESIRRETRNSRLLRIKLENTDSTEPLLWEINRRFEVEANILYSTINVIQGIVVGIMLVLFTGTDEEIEKAEQYILESKEEYREVTLP